MKRLSTLLARRHKKKYIIVKILDLLAVTGTRKSWTRQAVQTEFKFGASKS